METWKDRDRDIETQDGVERTPELVVDDVEHKVMCYISYHRDRAQQQSVPSRKTHLVVVVRGGHHGVDQRGKDALEITVTVRAQASCENV